MKLTHGCLLTTLVALLGLASQAAYSQNDQQQAVMQAALQQQLRRAQIDIQNAQLELLEVETRAQRVRNQIEAVSFMPPDMVSSQLQAFVSEKLTELKRWEVHAASAKARMMASETTLDNYRRQMGISPTADAFDWQQRISAQNFEIMRPSITPPPTRTPQNVLGFSAGTHLPDKDELALCQELEQKVQKSDYDIAEVNLLAAHGLPGSKNLNVEKI